MLLLLPIIIIFHGYRKRIWDGESPIRGDDGGGGGGRDRGRGRRWINQGGEFDKQTEHEYRIKEGKKDATNYEKRR